MEAAFYGGSDSERPSSSITFALSIDLSEHVNQPVDQSSSTLQ
jgi:hypothetical protein